MKNRIARILIACFTLLCFVSCSGPTEPQKRPVTGTSGFVIGVQKTEEPKPSASSSAPAASVTSTAAPVTTRVPVTQQSGTVRDDQEGSFRLRLEWNSYVRGEEVVVETALYLDCYSLTVNSVKKGFITVNGEKRSFSTEKISQTENVLTAIPVCNESFTVPVGEVSPGGIPVEAQWNFNGTYGGVEIEALTLSQVIPMS